MRLNDVADVVSGGTPPRADAECWNGTIPWITPTEVTRLNGRTLHASRESITDTGVRRAGLALLRPGTVLLTTRATIGAVARVGTPLTTNQGFQNLIAREGIDDGWLYYIAERSSSRLQRMAGGSTFKEVSRPSVRSLEVLVPPLPEQRGIAAVLDAVDEMIEQTEAVIAATEELREALLHDLFTRGVPGRHTEWKHVPGLGTIPACWNVVTLGECLSRVEYGTNAALNEAFRGTPVVRMGDLTDGEVNILGLKRAAQLVQDGLLLRPGDILFNRTNSIDLVGKVGLVGELSEPVSFASYLLRLQVTPSCVARWIFEVLHSGTSQQALRRMATKGASQANINPTSLKSLVVALPSFHEQRMMADLIESARSSVKANRDLLKRQQVAKVNLAGALLSGRVRVQPIAEVTA